MRAGYADTAARLPSHGDFLRATAPSPLAPGLTGNTGSGFDFARQSGTPRRGPLL